MIFKASLEQKQIPDDWLVTKVVSVHKSGGKQDIRNYQPISLTFVCCKFLEHISKSINSYLEIKRAFFF